MIVKKEAVDSSYSNDLAGVYFDFDEHDIVFDVVPFLQRLVGHEPRETETKRVRFFAGSLEVFPRRVGHEALHDIAGRLCSGLYLVVQNESDRVTKWPGQKGVVFAREYFDVD